MTAFPRIVLIALVLLPAVRAQEVPLSAPEVVRNYDTSGDRRLSEEEFRAFRGNRYLFRQIDLDRDGYVTVSELARRVADGRLDESSLVVLVNFVERARIVDVVDADADRDGRIAPKEFREHAFHMSDQNGDGAIDEPEADYLAQWDPFRLDFKGEGKRVLDRFDRTRDGRVTDAEFRPDEKPFRVLDRNGDGFLAPDELVPAPEQGLAQLGNLDADTVLERLDQNGDGDLDLRELPGGGGRLRHLDGDGDGALSRDELDRALQYARRMQFETLAPGFIERYDLNGDRRVSRAEFPAADSVFRRLDRNGDGVLARTDGS